jgi:hypothetical protein
MKKMSRLLNSIADLIAIKLQNVTEDLKAYPESEYWRGYNQGIADMMEAQDRKANK